MSTELLNAIINNKTALYVVIFVLAIVMVMMIVFFVQYNIDRAKGRHAKFLWFETNITPPISSTKSPTQTPIINNAKNINSGINNGSIGDSIYTGIKQRNFTVEDERILLSQIDEFKSKYKGKINPSHITIGYPRDKETTVIANQIYLVLTKAGYKNIQWVTLLTHGAIGQMFDVSNAPDDSIMIQIFPADNVE